MRVQTEPAVTFSPFQNLPQLRLGGDVGVTMVLDNSSRTLIIDNGNTIYRGSSDVPLWLLEPELRLSWRQYFGDAHTFFIEPGVAGGVAFGFLDLDGENGSYNSDASGTSGGSSSAGLQSPRRTLRRRSLLHRRRRPQLRRRSLRRS